MLFRYLFTSVLALGLASAAPAETRQAPTINIHLKHSTLNAIKTLDNVPLTDIQVHVDPPFSADIAVAECDGGCRIAFHCTLYGQNENSQIQVGHGKTKFIFDAFATIITISCAPGFPAEAESKRQTGGEGGLFVEFTNHPLEVTKTIRLDADGQPRAVNFDLQFPQGQQPFIGQITCYDDFGQGNAVDERAEQTKARQSDDVVQGTVVFSNEQGDRYEHELVLDELVVLPENILPVYYTDATVTLSHDPFDRSWYCKAFARGRASFDDLGVFYTNERFNKTFEGGEVYTWRCY